MAIKCPVSNRIIVENEAVYKFLVLYEVHREPARVSEIIFP